MTTFRRLAASLLFAVPTCISVAAFPQPASTSVDRKDCITSGSAATPQAAIAACTRLLETLSAGDIATPEGAAVYIARGNLYAVQGEVDRAIADYDIAITLDPDRAVAFFGRATVLMEKGEIDRALFDFDHAIELDPMDADARVGRGRAYYQKKDYKRAAIMFNPDRFLTQPVYMPSLETAARLLKVVPIIAHVHSDAEIETAITALGREPRGGLVVMPDAFTDVH